MPGFVAVKLCPALVFVRQDFELYQKYAAMLREVWRVYDKEFDCGSLDEAYLDVTEFMSRTGMDGGEIAAKLRSDVETKTRLTCSAGVAPTRDDSLRFVRTGTNQMVNLYSNVRGRR